MRLLEDPDFLEAADNRFDDPHRFNDMLSELTDDLIERYPNNGHDHGMAAAVRAAREATPSVDQGEFGGLDWSRMSPHDFQVKSREVLKAFKGGRLNNGRRRRHGFISTMPE